MPPKIKSTASGKIAAYVAKYSNAGTGNSYKNAAEAFLRCMFNLAKGKHDYESLFEQYLSDKKRDKSRDIKKFSEFLVKDSVSKLSARQRLTYAIKFLRAYGISILDEDVCDIKRETKGGAATVDKVMTHDVICRALQHSDIRGRAIILTLASSGLRIGELLSLRMSDIDLNSSPVMITVRAENAKNGRARYTFMSTEASEAVHQYLAVRDRYFDTAEAHVECLVKAGKTAKVNRQTDLLFPIADPTVNKMWETCLRKAGLFSRDDVSGRNQYRIHSLRKFFISQISLAGSRTLAEHLAGHTGYLDESYRQVSPEFAAREYTKLQSVLIVCIPESIKAGIKMADEKIGILMEKTDLQEESLEGMRAINTVLKQKMDRQEEQMARQAEQMIRFESIQLDMQNEIAKLRFEIREDWKTPADCEAEMKERVAEVGKEQFEAGVKEGEEIMKRLGRK